MTENFLKNYHVLGISPGATWKQLRQAYKKLVNTWHPDRFQQDGRQKRLAEEKTKEITQAYMELAEYHRNFGVLPLAAEERKPSVAEVSAPNNEATHETVPQAAPGENYSTVASEGTDSDRSSLRRPRVVMVAVLIASLYLIWLALPAERTEPPVFGSQDNPRATDSRASSIPDNANRDDERFSVGSSLGDVYAIQGVPTRTEDDIWHYGNSKVYFSKGKVVRWEESMDSPLQVDIIHSYNAPKTEYFGRGSSKGEVQGVQGAPDRDNGDTWDYGLSRVYFEHDRVTDWRESPINPLKVRR